MRSVLIYTPKYFPTYVGGGERLAQLTADGLRSLGIGASIVTEGRESSQYELDGVPVHVVPPDAERRVNDLFERLRPDVLHAIGAWGKPAVIRAAREHGLRVGAAGLDYGQFCDNHLLMRGSGEVCPGRISADDCFRCGLESSRRRDRWLGRLGAWLPASAVRAAEAGARVALGRPAGTQLEMAKRFQARDAARRAGVEALDLFVVPTQYAEARTRPHLAARTRCESLMYPRGTDLAPVTKRTSPSELVVGFVGRCLPMKGPHVLLDAIERAAAASVPVRAVVTVATNDGEAASYWRPLKARAEASSRVQWREAGVLDAQALADVHASIDVLAVPSLWPEYVGFVTLEALALGTPVILSDFAPQRELVRDPASGSLVRPGDADALARELAHCWKVKQKREAVLPYCPAPSADDYAQKLMRLYDEVAA